MYPIDWELFFPLSWFPKESEQFKCVEKKIDFQRQVIKELYV